MGLVLVSIQFIVVQVCSPSASAGCDPERDILCAVPSASLGLLRKVAVELPIITTEHVRSVDARVWCTCYAFHHV